jgi:hypothetical protein
MVMNKFKAEAVKMREAGYSYGMINERLGVPKGTLSEWFKAKPFKPNKEVLKRIQHGPILNGERRHNQKVEEVLRLRSKGKEEIGALSDRDFLLLGLGIYIGEGTKAFEQIQIANANPAVIKLMVQWFQRAFRLGTENITIAVHLYPDNDEKDCIGFWSKMTGVSVNNFQKTQVDIRKNKKFFKKGKLPYGTAHLSVNSNGKKEFGVFLARKINAWMEEVLK